MSNITKKLTNPPQWFDLAKYNHILSLKAWSWELEKRWELINFGLQTLDAEASWKLCKELGFWTKVYEESVTEKPIDELYENNYRGLLRGGVSSLRLHEFNNLTKILNHELTNINNFNGKDWDKLPDLNEPIDTLMTKDEGVFYVGAKEFSDSGIERNYFYLKVHLALTDKELIEQFKKWLASARAIFDENLPPLCFDRSSKLHKALKFETKSDLRNLKKESIIRNVIPYIDLLIHCKINNLKLPPNTKFAIWLGTNTDIFKKYTKPLSENILDTQILRAILKRI